MPSRRQFLEAGASAATGTWLAAADGADASNVEAGQRPAAVPLRPGSAADSFEFETEAMEGTIRLDGAYHGVTRLVDKRTGRQVIDARYSALNLFKLQAVNHYMGQPRLMPRTTSAAPTAVDVTWPATESYLAEISARYEVRGPSAIDATVRVRSAWSYRGHEVFMSSYFDKVLRPHVYVKALNPRQIPNHDLIVPMLNDVFRGAVLVFPRDPNAAQRCVDGRWERKEGNVPFVQMCPVRPYAYCLSLMVDPEAKLGAVMMSRPRHCYAVSSRYFAEKDADRPTTYSAFDHSLFGDDLAAGEERTARVRLAITPLDDKMSQPTRALSGVSGGTRRRASRSKKFPRLRRHRSCTGARQRSGGGRGFAAVAARFCAVRRRRPSARPRFRPPGCRRSRRRPATARFAWASSGVATAAARRQCKALTADSGAVLTAMGDLFDDRVGQSLELLRKHVPDKVRVDPAKRFLGFDAHQKVIDSDVDVVLLCTPPGFRAAHLAAAVAAGKHSFVEIAAAVDAPGIRSFLASAELARQKNLAIVSGFCWRYNFPHAGRARPDSKGADRRDSSPLFHVLPQPYHPQAPGAARPEMVRPRMADPRLARLHVAVGRRDPAALGGPQRR